jgi:arsenite/tail-anchored protein-transporting ATPase
MSSDFNIGSKRLIFVTGKGGIGKSLIAASLAKKHASDGKKVLLLAQSATDHLGPLFGANPIGHETVEVAPNLQLANMTAAGNFKDFVVKHLKRGALFEALASNRVVHSFFGAIPGFGELMFLGRLYYTLNLADLKPDLVIVDGYSSGHFLSLMTTPDAVLESGLAGPIANETTKVKQFLSDETQTGIILVGVLEDLVLTEMLDFVPKLNTKSPTKICSIIFNRCLNLNTEGTKSVFLSERLKLQDIARQSWIQKKALLGINADIPTYMIPDLGFVSEPITNQLVDRLLEPTEVK